MAGIDAFSVASLPIEMRFDVTPLSLGTAFVWQVEDEKFLITNWHNVSGRDPRTGKHLSPTAAEPDHLHVWFNVKSKLGDKISKRVDLRSNDGVPTWFVHPGLGRAVDVVALPLSNLDDVDFYPINKMPLMSDLQLEIGMDVFVLGYPFGLGPAGFPVWKRGSIASEPQLLDPASPVVFIDTASRPGMSGSPIIQRSWGAHSMAGGGVAVGSGTATNLFGIYSGRLASSDPSDAQLGMSWPIYLVDEIIKGRRADA